MWWFYLCILFTLGGGLGYFDYGITCIPGTEWSTGECGQKCKCLTKGITHCIPNPCLVVKHNSNGEIQVREAVLSDSGIFYGRDITRLVDRRVLFPDQNALRKKFINYGQ